MDKRVIEYSSSHRSEIGDVAIEDIDRDKEFVSVFNLTREYTMTSKEVMYSLYNAVRYVAQRRIRGDFVECGVWRGGSSLLAALAFQLFEVEKSASTPFSLDGGKRSFWLYDTFEGMTQPTDVDIDVGGVSAAAYLDEHSDSGKWCYADYDDVRLTFRNHGFEYPTIRLVKGDVKETLRSYIPKKISILRLDTDWYESTKLELELLYPKLAKGGVLIVDDYGHWEGARRAVDEYFAHHPAPLFARTSYAVRTAVKI